MGLCIEKLSHPLCGSRDGLQVFQDNQGFTGYCFACETYVPDPYGDNLPPKRRQKKTPEEIAALIQEINECPILAAPERCLSLETMQYFGIRTGLSEGDGVTPVFHYFPYYIDGDLTGYKVRFLPEKRMWAVGNIKDADLFGQSQALAGGTKTLFITEGEYDAPSLFQVLKKKAKGSKWEELDPAAVSLINGAGSATRDLNRLAPKLPFGDVVLVYDQDEKGERAVRDTMQIYPNAKSVKLPEKDANAMLVANKPQALANAVLFKKEKPRNTRLVWGYQLHEAGRALPKMGLSWPWEGMTRKTRGFRFGETIYLGAGVKMGKSELVNAITAHLILEHGLKVFLAKPEEANAKTYKLLCSKVAGKFFHDPTVEFDYNAYDKASALVGDNVCVLDLYQHLGWNSLRANIHETAAEGCKAIFIDPITNLTNGVASGDANVVLQGIAQELAAIAKDLELIIFIFCHLKAPESGPPHERGGKVLSHQFAGSRAMMRSCNYMIGLEGNKDPDLAIEQRNMRKLILLEDREFGESGHVDLYWDHNTGLFNEVQER